MYVCSCFSSLGFVNIFQVYPLWLINERLPRAYAALYREKIEVSSCEIFCPYVLTGCDATASRFFEKSDVELKNARSEFSRPRSKNYFKNLYLTESPTKYIPGAKIRSKIGQVELLHLPKNVSDFCEKCGISPRNRLGWLCFLSFCRQTFRKHGYSICACKLSAKTYTIFMIKWKT